MMQNIELSLCVFQVLNSALCADTWQWKSVETVLKSQYSTQQDLKSFVRSVQLRWVV